MGTFYKTWQKKVSHEQLRKCHLLHEIETDGIRLITFKWYSKSKQHWVYESEPTYQIEVWMVDPKY